MLEWFDVDAVEIEKDIELPQFDLLNVTTTRCDAKKYKTGETLSISYKYISQIYLQIIPCVWYHLPRAQEGHTN